MKRSYGEVVRAAHHLKSLRAMLDSIELVVKDEDPPGSDAQQALVMEAYNLAQCISRLDAYRRAEADSADAAAAALVVSGRVVSARVSGSTVMLTLNPPAEHVALPTKPVCDSCHDTHQVHNEERGESRMCTRCPRPCRKCANGYGRGAYCAKTPCACACHKLKGRKP